MLENNIPPGISEAKSEGQSPNVKPSGTRHGYDRFGETVRYLTVEELQQFFDAIDDYRHKLMMRLIYELGCRVGEFVRIQLKHVSFPRSSVYFPANNTKTGARRTSHLPPGLVNELKSMLRQQGRMLQRSEQVRRPEEYLFYPAGNPRRRYTENRLRQIFRHYVQKLEFDREYGRDTKDRALHELTIHSLRHSHIMHYIHVYRLPLPVVQRQVGHKTLKTTSVYLRPSDEHVGQAYAEARRRPTMVQPKHLYTADSLSFQNDTTTQRTHR